VTPTITQDVGRAVSVGLDAYDRYGKRLGYVDRAGRAQRWMQVTLGPVELPKLWIPYRLVKTADAREIFVKATRSELHRSYALPPRVRRRRGAPELGLGVPAQRGCRTHRSVRD